MEGYTTESGVQLYIGNFLDESDVGREVVGCERRTDFYLKTQHVLILQIVIISLLLFGDLKKGSTQKPYTSLV